MCASEKGRVEAVRLLVGAGADACAADVDGWTPLAFAARGGHLAVVTEILDAGALIDSRDCVSFNFEVKFVRERMLLNHDISRHKIYCFNPVNDSIAG